MAPPDVSVDSSSPTPLPAERKFGDGLTARELDACNTWIANALGFSSVELVSRATQAVSFKSPWQGANFGIICGKFGFASASYSDGPWTPKGFLQFFGLIGSAVVPATPMKIEEVATACALKARARGDGQMIEMRVPGGVVQCTLAGYALFAAAPMDKKATANQRLHPVSRSK